MIGAGRLGGYDFMIDRKQSTPEGTQKSYSFQGHSFSNLLLQLGMPTSSFSPPDYESIKGLIHSVSQSLSTQESLEKPSQTLLDLSVTNLLGIPQSY